MRVSELAERTGVSIPTLKYYLREGLLHPGESESRTRASYDESHVARVRLVRALVGAGGLGIEQVKVVVRALEDPPATRHELLGTAHAVLSAGELPADSGNEPLVTGLDWPVHPASPASRQVAAALGQARAAGWDVSERAFGAWASGALVQARADVSSSLGTLSPSEALEYAILGTALTDPVIRALRRLAQEAVSAERLT